MNIPIYGLISAIDLYIDQDLNILETNDTNTSISYIDNIEQITCIEHKDIEIDINQYPLLLDALIKILKVRNEQLRQIIIDIQSEKYR